MSLHNFFTIKRKVTTDANDNVVAPKRDRDRLYDQEKRNRQFINKWLDEFAWISEYVGKWNFVWVSEIWNQLTHG